MFLITNSYDTEFSLGFKIKQLKNERKYFISINKSFSDISFGIVFEFPDTIRNDIKDQLFKNTNNLKMLKWRNQLYYFRGVGPQIDKNLKRFEKDKKPKHQKSYFCKRFIQNDLLSDARKTFICPEVFDKGYVEIEKVIVVKVAKWNITVWSQEDEDIERELKKST